MLNVVYIMLLLCRNAQQEDQFVVLDVLADNRICVPQRMLTLAYVLLLRVRPAAINTLNVYVLVLFQENEPFFIIVILHVVFLFILHSFIRHLDLDTLV